MFRAGIETVIIFKYNLRCLQRINVKVILVRLQVRKHRFFHPFRNDISKRYLNGKNVAVIRAFFLRDSRDSDCKVGIVSKLYKGETAI